VVQGLAWTAAAILVPTAILLNALQLIPVFALLLMIGLGFFLVRVGWRALAIGPLQGGPRSWVFYGTFWLVVFVGLFIWAAVAFVEDFSAAPAWFFVAFAHSAFVGMMTNLLLGVYAARTQDSSAVLAWGEPAARWLINLGLLAFIVLKATSDTRQGAIAMGIGVLLGVFTMIRRLLASGTAMAAQPRPAAVAGSD
jgi:hypothetical protein